MPDAAPSQSTGDASHATSTPQTADARDKILFLNETERFKPLMRKLVHNTIMDQKEIWTSPFHMHRSDSKWWLVFGGSTAALIATDRRLARELPNTKDQTSISRYISEPGAVYTLFPLAGLFYFGGVLAESPKAREAGALGAEALTDAMIVSSVLKAIIRRQRPEDASGNGNFFQGGTSFPSGHALMSWALASVVAHEYHNTPIIPITAYTLAAVVSAARVSGRKHWPSDIVAGAGMGWFIGRYVYRTHADHAIHHHAPMASLRPKVMPLMSPAERTYGVSLTWNLGR